MQIQEDISKQDISRYLTIVRNYVADKQVDIQLRRQRHELIIDNEKHYKSILYEIDADLKSERPSQNKNQNRRQIFNTIKQLYFSLRDCSQTKMYLDLQSAIDVLVEYLKQQKQHEEFMASKFNKINQFLQQKFKLAINLEFMSQSFNKLYQVGHKIHTKETMTISIGLSTLLDLANQMRTGDKMTDLVSKLFDIYLEKELKPVQMFYKVEINDVQKILNELKSSEHYLNLIFKCDAIDFNSLQQNIQNYQYKSQTQNSGSYKFQGISDLIAGEKNFRNLDDMDQLKHIYKLQCEYRKFVNSKKQSNQQNIRISQTMVQPALHFIKHSSESIKRLCVDLQKKSNSSEQYQFSNYINEFTLDKIFKNSNIISKHGISIVRGMKEWGICDATDKVFISNVNNFDELAKFKQQISQMDRILVVDEKQEVFRNLNKLKQQLKQANKTNKSILGAITKFCFYLKTSFAYAIYIRNRPIIEAIKIGHQQAMRLEGNSKIDQLIAEIKCLLKNKQQMVR